MKSYPLANYFILASGISWFIWMPLWLPHVGVSGLPVVPFHHALGAAGPVCAAFIVSAAEAGRAGPADLLRQMVRWRGRMTWIATALLAPFALFLLALAGSYLFGDERVTLSGLGRTSEFPQFSPIGFLLFNIFTFGYGEETGWRGFALPRLQARYSAFTATLLVTFGWALWHLPLFLYRPGYLTMDAAGVAGWLFSLLTGAVLLTWIYNGSRGSILAAALFHAAIDIVFTSDMASPLVINTTGGLITVAGITVLIAAGPRFLSRCGKMVYPYNGMPLTGLDSRDDVVG